MVNNVAIPVFLYHKIILNGHPSRYMLHWHDFVEQMNLICVSGSKCLTAEEYWDNDWSEEREGKFCLITFDDGFADNYSAFIFLRDLGLSGTFFVITSLVGTKGYLGWNQLQEMLDAGMSVQSHSASHQYLSSLTTKKLNEELISSKEMIENKMGKKVSFLSLPYGDYSSRVVSAALYAGYQGIFTSKVHYARGKRDVLIPRINIDPHMSNDDFKLLLAGKYSALFFRQRAKQIVKDFVKTATFYKFIRKK